MNIYFLGSGSECNYQYPRRRNTSLLFEFPKGNLLVDVGDSFPDNWNILKTKNCKLKFPSVLLITHDHLDHDCSLAAYRNYSKEEKVNYGTLLTRDTLKKIKKTFHWLKDDDFKIISFIKHGKEFDCLGEKILPFGLKHGKVISTGFRIADISYLPDFDGTISGDNFEIVKGSSIVIMECNNFRKKYAFHNNFYNAINLGKKFKKFWNFNHLILTHLGDDFPVNKDECQRFIQQQTEKVDFKVSFSFDLMKIKI